MKIKMKVAYRDDRRNLAPGDETTEFPMVMAQRLVRAGIADEVPDLTDWEEIVEQAVSVAMLRDDLVEIAHERGITVDPGDTKANIVAKIEAADAS